MNRANVNLGEFSGSFLGSLKTRMKVVVALLIEGHELPALLGPSPAAQIVIVGAGPVGIASARRLRQLGCDVLVLEAGGLPPDNSRETHFSGESVGQSYNMVRTRYRGLGGATNVWSGWSRPLDQFEFDFQPWIGGLPWPMRRAELLPHYRRAAQLLGLGEWEWNAERIAARQGQSSLARVSGAQERLASLVWRFAPPPLSFAERFSHFLNEPSTKVVLNAPVTKVRVRSNQARSVEVALQSGRRIQIAADTVILAGGGIENVRLLLETQNQMQRVGRTLDRSGWLGRGWQEHPHVAIASALIPESVAQGPLWLYSQRRTITGVRVLAGLSLPERVLREQKMGAISLTLETFPTWNPDAVPYSEGVLVAAERATEELIEPRVLYARSESRTVRGSRISLGRSRDPLGRRQARLNWSMARQDFRDLEVAAHYVARAFADLNFGAVHVNADRKILASTVRGGAHHIGGARMSSNPRSGVTNSFGAVHQIPNLYVTGSATFPSGGFSNPTLTILALALRQADHIARKNR